MLHTIDPPDVTTTNSLMVSFQEDSTLSLNCGFVGIPTVSLVWMNNGRLLSNSDDSITITVSSGPSSNTSTLQWMNIPLNANGSIDCVATNNLGSDRLSIGLQILSKFVFKFSTLALSELLITGVCNNLGSVFVIDTSC